MKTAILCPLLPSPDDGGLNPIYELIKAIFKGKIKRDITARRSQVEFIDGTTVSFYSYYQELELAMRNGFDVVVCYSLPREHDKQKAIIEIARCKAMIGEVIII